MHTSVVCRCQCFYEQVSWFIGRSLLIVLPQLHSHWCLWQLRKGESQLWGPNPRQSCWLMFKIIAGVLGLWYRQVLRSACVCSMPSFLYGLQMARV